MQLQQPFDARQVEPASFVPPPVLGDYHVRIADSEAKPTKDNSGGYMQFMLEILDPGPYQGRKIPYNLNIFNANPQTVEIAYRQLSALCYVTGVFSVQDTRQLHNIPFIATIGPQKNDPQYSNVFTVKDINGNPPGKAGQPAAQPGPPQPPAPTATAPAWAPPAPPAAAAPPWGAPPAAAPAWQPPAPPVWPGTPAAAPPAAAPAWQPPQAPAAPAPSAAPPWAPAGAPPAAPPWAK